MSGSHLPVEDHIARYCPGSKITTSGNILPTAFYLRPGEAYLSVEWLEYLKSPSRQQAIVQIQNILSGKLRLGASARIAVLNVGEVCRHVAEMSCLVIRVLHEPEHLDLAHSGIS